MSADDALRRFRKAERRQRASPPAPSRKPPKLTADAGHERQRTHYAYPPSPTSPGTPARAAPPAQRLRHLQAELAALERELEDPAAPGEDDADGAPDAGELLKGLVDVRGRLDHIRAQREGRGRLVGVLTGDGAKEAARDAPPAAREESQEDSDEDEDETRETDKSEVPARSIAEMDRRVGQLEELIGSASTTLDEARPPAPSPPPSAR